MKNKSLYAAMVCFFIGLAFFWVGRVEIAKSIPLMSLVSFWFLMAFLFALHADTAGNLQVIVQNIPLLRGVITKTVVETDEEKPS
jgi:hypothetical protein